MCAGGEEVTLGMSVKSEDVVVLDGVLLWLVFGLLVLDVGGMCFAFMCGVFVCCCVLCLFVPCFCWLQNTCFLKHVDQNMFEFVF